jgi:hypothetical protein
MRFDKDMPKKRRKKREEHKLVQEEPDESIEEAVDESAEEVPVEPAEEVPPVVEELKSKEPYETSEGTAILQYDKTESKKGYTAPSKKEGFCELREKNKAVYGIKYAAGKGVSLIKKARTAIMDWCNILPKKSSAERKDKEDLV